MSFEMNKIAGAILAAMILAMVSGLIASNLVKPVPLAKPAYVVASAEPSQAKPEDAAKAAAPEPIEPLLASADANAGKDVAKKCQLCHTFDKGGANKIGPNLYGVIGEPIAEGKNGYQFSTALKDHKGNWNIDELNQWLTNPQSFAKGTKMTFAGLPNAKDRANVIAYLNSLSDSPKPLPTGK
jgi:cytochrome c